MGTVYTIASGKGGTGKTTLTANLGISLAFRGKKVLLIDTDIAMANLSLLLGMHSSPITLHDVLLGESAIQDAIYDGPGGVNFVPSGLSLESYRRVDSERLETIIAVVKDQYDYILLDAPAGIEKNVMSSIAAADQVLLISQPNPPSVADALKTKIVAQRLGGNPIGIVMNFVRGEKGEISDEDIMKMLELPIYGIIPYDDEVRKSFMQEKIMPVILRKPRSPASAAISKIALKISGEKVEFERKQGESALKRFLNKLSSIFKRGEKKPKEKDVVKELEERKKSRGETGKEDREVLPEIDSEFIEVGGKE